MKKNRRFFWGAPVLALIFALALTACDHNGGSSFISGDITGIWTGTFDGMKGTLAINGSSGIGGGGSWTMTDDGSYYQTGTYKMNGNTATLYSSSSSVIPIGTAGLISSNTLVVTLNAITGSPGTYTATRSSSFTGVWTGQMGGYSATITIYSSTWSISSYAGYSDSGTYTASGSTATLRNSSYTVIGTANISGGTLYINLNAYSSFPGTYTFTQISS